MGRYDKIKVYNGSAFVKPKRIRVYDGRDWIDLGPDDSEFKKSLYVRHAGTNKRITLNKIVTEVAGPSYRNGMFTAKPKNGYCFCPISTKAGKYSFSFEGYIRRASAGVKNIFKSYGTRLPANYIYITLNADNTIKVSTSCTFDNAGNLINTARGDSKTTIAQILPDTWNYVKVWADKGEKNVKVQINDDVETLRGLTYTWLVASDNRVADDGLHLRADNFLLKSADGNGINRKTEDANANVNEVGYDVIWR